jgi:hypothetical protein
VTTSEPPIRTHHDTLVIGGKWVARSTDVDAACAAVLAKAVVLLEERAEDFKRILALEAGHPHHHRHDAVRVRGGIVATPRRRRRRWHRLPVVPRRRRVRVAVPPLGFGVEVHAVGVGQKTQAVGHRTS